MILKYTDDYLVNGDIISYYTKENKNKPKYAVYYISEQNPMANIIIFDKIDGFKYGCCDEQDIIIRIRYAADLINSSDAALLCVYDHLKKNMSINDLLYGYSSPEEYIKEGKSIRDRTYILT